MYWPDWMCARAREAGLEGTALRVVWGGHNRDSSFGHSRLGSGDTLVPVTVVDGVVFALARLVVLKKTTAEVWLAANPGDAVTKLHGCGAEVVVAADGSALPLAFDRPFNSDELDAWRYDGSAGPRPLKFLEGGRLKKPLSMQGIYRVTPATQTLIEAVLARTKAPKAKTAAAELEAALARSPADERAARVLADAWQDAGDARGEVMAIELALAREHDLERARGLDARHAALLRQAGAKKRPGGFPFRMLQGARGFEVLVVAEAPLAGSTPSARLDALAAFCGRVLEPAGASSLEVHTRTISARAQEVLDALGAVRQPGPSNVFSRKARFSTAELEQVALTEGALRLVFAGSLRAADDGPALPLQHGSQWLGSPLTSEVRASLVDGRLTATLRAPLGTPFADKRLAELERSFQAAGLRVVRETWRRTATGVDALVQGPPRAH